MISLPSPFRAPTGDFRRIHRRFLRVGVLFSLVAAVVFTYALPVPLPLRWIGSLVAFGFAVAAFGLGGAPETRPWVTHLYIGTGVLGLIASAWFQPQGVFPNLLNILPAACFGATVFGGVAFSLATAGLSALALAALVAFRPEFQIDPALRQMVNLALVLVFQQSLLAVLWSYVQRALLDAQKLSVRTSNLAHATQELAVRTFQSARDGLTAIRAGLESGDQVTAMAAARAMQAELAQARAHFSHIPEPPPASGLERDLESYRLRMRGVFQWALGLALAAALIWNSVLPPLPHRSVQWVCLAVFLAFALLRRLDARRERLWFRAALALFFLLSEFLAYPQMERAPGAFPANQCGVAFAVLVVALLDGPGAALAALGWFAGTLELHAFLKPSHPVGETALVLFATALACWVAQGLPHAIFRNLNAQERALAEALKRRRRLVSMLFHDLANPLHVLSLQIEESGDAQRTGRLLDRMEAALTAARQLDHSEVNTRATTLPELFENLGDLYGERLDEKRLFLELRCPDFSVRVQPELFRENVLGNVLSNAIRFAPVGSSIRVGAKREGDQVVVNVDDEGPGFPALVLDALAKGRSVPRAPLGGQGFGYGLNLAQDCLAEMGGRLELGAAPGGGARATLSLPRF